MPLFRSSVHATLILFGGGSIGGGIIGVQCFWTKSSNIVRVTGALILSITASAVLSALGNDLSVRSRMNTQRPPSSLHSTILPSRARNVRSHLMRPNSFPLPVRRLPMYSGRQPVFCTSLTSSRKSIEFIESGFHLSTAGVVKNVYASSSG